MAEEFDVIILGGGLVGLMLARLLTQAESDSLRVALITPDKPALSWAEQSFDNRCCAVNHAAMHLFQRLGLWESIVAQQACFYDTMEVWDKLRQGKVVFDAHLVGTKTLGHIIENRVMQKVLWQGLQCQIFYGRAIELIREGELKIQLSDDASSVFNLKAKVIVGADGGNSWLRNAAEIDSYQWSHKQKAIVTVVSTEKPHCHTAYQCFTQDGPLAFLPLAEQYSSAIVWSVKTKRAEDLLQLSDQEFCLNLQDEFDHRLGACQLLNPRQAFALRTLHAKQYTKNGIVLVGDAAHVVHPLAGQGVNLGFMDVANLAELILQADQKHGNIGHSLVLRRYERWRKAHTLSMIAAVEFFNRLFQSSDHRVAWLRDTGMRVFNKTRVLKKTTILRAMGIQGDVVYGK